MNERAGRAVLRSVFERAGFTIVEDVKKRFDSGEVTLDGWDEARRVGYEFITTEDGDRAEFTTPVVEEIERRMHAREFYLFLVDESTTGDQAALERAAARFLDVLQRRGVA